MFAPRGCAKTTQVLNCMFDQLYIYIYIYLLLVYGFRGTDFDSCVDLLMVTQHMKPSIKQRKGWMWTCVCLCVCFGRQFVIENYVGLRTWLCDIHSFPSGPKHHHRPEQCVRTR